MFVLAQARTHLTYADATCVAFLPAIASCHRINKSGSSVSAAKASLNTTRREKKNCSFNVSLGRRINFFISAVKTLVSYAFLFSFLSLWYASLACLGLFK